MCARALEPRGEELDAAVGGGGHLAFEMEGALQKIRQDVLTAENRINRARSRCTTLEVDLKTYQVKHASLTESAIELKEEVAILEQGLVEIQRLLEKRRAEQVASEGAVEKALSDSREILTQFRNLQEQIQEQDRGIARKTAQLNVLEGLQAKFEGFGEGAKAILGDKLNEVVSKGSVSIISKELTVDNIYTTALETLLGSAADALYIGDSAKALSVIGKLDADFLGRACLRLGTGLVRPLSWWVRLIGLDSLECGSPEMWDSL